jgi:hypothetical protein
MANPITKLNGTPPGKFPTRDFSSETYSIDMVNPAAAHRQVNFADPRVESPTMPPFHGAKSKRVATTLNHNEHGTGRSDPSGV